MEALARPKAELLMSLSYIIRGGFLLHKYSAGKIALRL